MEKPNAFWRNVFSVEIKMQSFDAVWIIENPKKLQAFAPNSCLLKAMKKNSSNQSLNAQNYHDFHARDECTAVTYRMLLLLSPASTRRIWEDDLLITVQFYEQHNCREW